MAAPFVQHSGISCAGLLNASMAAVTFNHFLLNISYDMVTILSSPSREAESLVVHSLSSSGAIRKG